MSSPSEGGPESTHPVRQTLILESLDAEGLWQALNNVEKALPELLLCLKPILWRLGAHGTSLGEISAAEGGEKGEDRAREAIRDYMAILDDVQNVLRQAAFYLKATKTSPSTLRPPPPTSIHTPFASTLPRGPLPAGDPILVPDPTRGSEEDEEDGAGDRGQVELGLYASRIELRTLRAMKDGLAALRREELSRQNGTAGQSSAVEGQGAEDEPGTDGARQDGGDEGMGQ